MLFIMKSIAHVSSIDFSRLGLCVVFKLVSDALL